MFLRASLGTTIINCLSKSNISRAGHRREIKFLYRADSCSLSGRGAAGSLGVFENGMPLAPFTPFPMIVSGVTLSNPWGSIRVASNEMEVRGAGEMGANTKPWNCVTAAPVGEINAEPGTFNCEGLSAAPCGRNGDVDARGSTEGWVLCRLFASPLGDTAVDVGDIPS